MSKSSKKQKAGEVLQAKHIDQRDQDLQNLIAIHESHQGPLPRAADFAAYERVQKGAAHRIIRMAEKALGAEVFSVRIGKVTEFVAMILSRLFLYALLASAVFLVLQDKAIEGLLLGLAPIVSVIYSTFKKPDNKADSNQK